jgi:hypothetical protein
VKYTTPLKSHQQAMRTPATVARIKNIGASNIRNHQRGMEKIMRMVRTGLTNTASHEAVVILS